MQARACAVYAPWLAEACKVSIAFVQLLGTVFMGLQGLASTGIITINWERTTELFGQYADINGDGKVDKADAEHAIKELQVRTVPSSHQNKWPLYLALLNS